MNPSRKMLIVCENNGMKRILLVKTSSLGDVIHNLPVVNDILQQHPSAHIDWVVEEGFADIPKLHSSVNQVFTIAIRHWRKALFHQKTWHEIIEFKHLISAQPYDYIIDTQGLIKSALVSRFAKGEKYGYDQASAREKLASLFYNHQHYVARNQHAVVRNRELVAKVFGYQKPLDRPDYGISKSIPKADIKLPQQFMIGLHGTSKDSKLWPIENWINLAKQLEKNHLQLVLPWANDAEYQRAIEIANKQHNIFILPKLTIARIASVISEAQAAIGVDTGLSHLAAAIEIPTVAIYTDTNPARTGVMASMSGQAINLGGIKTTPSVSSVVSALNSIKPLI
jgi:heptosyltransferase I